MCITIRWTLNVILDYYRGRTEEETIKYLFFLFCLGFSSFLLFIIYEISQFRSSQNYQDIRVQIIWSPEIEPFSKHKPCCLLHFHKMQTFEFCFPKTTAV